jgi:hypothetical protein
VPGVVLDPELLAAGLLGHARPRKLLALFALGRWARYGQLLGPAELALVEQDLKGGGHLGASSLQELIELARDHEAQLTNLLDYGAPDDLVLVASKRIIDATTARVELARRVEPSAREQTDLARRARRVLNFLALITPGSILAEPEATESIRDHLIHVAAASSAPLVSDDVLLAAGDHVMWQHTDTGGLPAVALTSWTFIDSHVDRAPFTLDSIPYDLLGTAVRRIESST